MLLFDDEEEFIGDNMHLAHVVGHILLFDLEHARLDAWFAEVLDERLALGHPLVGTEEEEEAFFLLLLVGGSNLLLRVDEELLAELALSINNGLYVGKELLEELVITLGYRTGDDERRTSIVDKDGVHFVNDGVVVATLHEVFGAGRHVVAQVVEPKFIVRPEGDVCVVGGTALRSIGAVLVDTVDTQTMEHVQRTHPLRVTLGEVVVHGDDVDTVTRECVEEDGERSYEGLTFPSSHFSDLPLVKDGTPEELYIVVHHIPGDLVPTSQPVVLIDRRIAFDTNEVVGDAEVAVEVRCLDADLGMLCEATPRALDDGEGFGVDFIQDDFELVKNLLLEFVYLSPDSFTLIKLLAFYAGLEFFYLGAFARYVVVDALAERGGASSQVVVRECVDLGVNRLDALYPRRDLLEVTL